MIMGNLGEEKPMSKLVIEIGGNEYVISGGGGGSQPGPDTVGTDQIIDGAVEEQDLSEDVKEKTRSTYDAENEGIKLGGL